MRCVGHVGIYTNLFSEDLKRRDQSLDLGVDGMKLLTYVKVHLLNSVYDPVKGSSGSVKGEEFLQYLRDYISYIVNAPCWESKHGHSLFPLMIT
jgi:hypothetical protein